MSSAKTLFSLELAFLAGIACGRYPIRTILCAAVLISAVVALFARPRLLLTMAMLCAATLGTLRFQMSDAWAAQDGLRPFVDRSMKFSGRIVADVDLRQDEQRFVLRVDDVGSSSASFTHPGRMLVVAPRYPEQRYGTRLIIRCRLAQPEPAEDFAYDEYLALSRIYSICRKPDILQTVPPTLSIASTLFSFKHWMVDRLSSSLPEPHAALLAGILLGVRQGIPDSLTESFQRAGLSHIVALSGYNVTILVGAVMGGTIRMGASRRSGFWIASFFILCFVLMTGAAASVMRAGMMGFLVCLARHVGRVSRIWYAIVFAAAVMAMLNPRILLHDVGFQLSFLATLGLVLFATPISKHLAFLPDRFGLRDALASTLAATIATLPLLATQFERISLISPLANVLVLPAIPLLMLLGVGVFLPVITPLLAAASWILLTWVISASEWLARLSWASIDIPSLPTWTPLFWYAVGVLSIAVWKKLHHLPKTKF